MTAEGVIHAALRRATRRRRQAAAIGTLSAGLVGAAAVALTAMLADRWLQMSPLLRSVAAISVVTILFASWVRAIWLVAVTPFDAVAAARAAEACDEAWAERLSTVVTQTALPAAYRGSAAMTAVLVERVAKEITERPPAKRVPLIRLGKTQLAVLAVAMAWCLAAGVPQLDVPRLAARLVRPWSGVAAVTSARLELSRAADTIEQGRPLTIEADLLAGRPPVTLHIGPDVDRLRPLEMSHAGGTRYRITLLAPPDDVVYRVTADDASVGPVAVKVLRRPGVTGVDVVLRYADGRPPLTLTGGDGRLRAPAGTRVGVVFRATEPLRSAALRVGAASIEAVPDVDRRTWRAEFVVTADADWSIDLRGERGIDGRGPDGMRVTVER